MKPLPAELILLSNEFSYFFLLLSQPEYEVRKLFCGCDDRIKGEHECDRMKRDAGREIEDLAREDCGVDLKCRTGIFHSKGVVGEDHECSSECRGAFLFGCKAECKTRCRYEVSCHG